MLNLVQTYFLPILSGYLRCLQGPGCDVNNAQFLPFMNLTGVMGSKGQNEGLEGRKINSMESKLSRTTIKSMKDMLDSLEAMEEDPDGIVEDLEYTVVTT